VVCHLDKKIREVNNGMFDPIPYGKYVVCLVVYKFFDILTFLKIQH
jgi:hypothetical protein